MASRIVYKGKQFIGKIIKFNPREGNNIDFFDEKTKQVLTFNLLDLDVFTTKDNKTLKRKNHLQFYKHKYERHSIVNSDDVFFLIGCSKEKITLNNVKINVYSNRLQCFLKERKCKHCGIEGTFFAIERSLRTKVKYLEMEYCDFHLNFYHKDKFDREILMTADHIIPKSRGGEDNLNNLQTLCEICNKIKGNSLEEEIRKRKSV